VFRGGRERQNLCGPSISFSTGLHAEDAFEHVPRLRHRGGGGGEERSGRGGPAGPPRSCHSAITNELLGVPRIFPASGGAMVSVFIDVNFRALTGLV